MLLYRSTQMLFFEQINIFINKIQWVMKVGKHGKNLKNLRNINILINKNKLIKKFIVKRNI